ncbi:MAG TPA: hypothetical protein VNI84_09185 [Pyrinomonadaceae bacterium]|nr:hypothetical protein [Pyrinomonadaceae bacterium]
MENIEFRKGAVDAANCISEGWNFIKSNYWLFFAMSVVYLLIVIVAGNIPYAGNVINIIVGGALTCGIYIALLAQWRRQSVPFSLMFEGFSRIVPATLVTIIASIPWLVFGLAIGLFVVLPNMTPGAEDPAQIINAIFNRAVLVPLVLGYLTVLLVSIVFSLLLFFALPLIADRNAGIGDALKLSVGAALNNIGGLLALLIFEGLLLIAGAIACGVGILFVLPVIYAANIVAYKSVFPDDAPQFNDAPPRPEDYGGNYGTPQ